MAIKTGNLNFQGNNSYTKTDFKKDRQYHLLDKQQVLHSPLREKEHSPNTLVLLICRWSVYFTMQHQTFNLLTTQVRTPQHVHVATYEAPISHRPSYKTYKFEAPNIER